MKRACIMEDSIDNVPNKVSCFMHDRPIQEITSINTISINKNNSNDLLQLAMEIQKADNCIKANACNKLSVIAEQMRFLHKQAHDILSEVKVNTILHHAACNFIKHPGHIYHLYQKRSGSLYFSMLSPEEWGNFVTSQVYKGSFRLEHDHSWTPLNNIKNKDDEQSMFDKLLKSNDTSAINMICK
ncbi:uncharacterized protein C1orf50 homolog [Orussus abietinus]|uniref:uncharacterized protein C1orf50 homolog n=1 Tax=Orussus abietinus TaxID=222816 RepID=UPI000625B60C|nr:uncharacterized protein C1orf50 homolog [Orussus abietinus]XP_012270713.1 uncharacterized protein C1orf50 homolog [Orussus abietinus]XP_012270714.1 uncharacterized protein C1orf50 homolog [Orussus abietinus]XP_012270715.1 uncharacterized protein C1orf50 homolog [Orussus abietinus]XP_012270716.1 uncharacterized protein C1orf50 homolog [Orussus abietinus]